MNNFSIRARIKSLREDSGITQSEMADRLGVCRTSVINIETKSKLVSPRLAEIAKALDTTEEYLLFGNKTEEEKMRLYESYADTMFKEQKKQIIDDYERRLAELQRQLQEFGEICHEQRDHINTLKQIIQRLELNSSN